MKILITYDMFPESFGELAERYEVTRPAGRSFTYDEVLEMIPDYDVLCPMFSFKVDKALIDKGERLKLIANYAVGFDNIDVAYAAGKGITVTNTPDPVIAPTANLALGLMIDAARRITENDRHLRAGKKTDRAGILHGLGTQVSGKILGILGMGRIGKALAKRANACGMEVVYHNRRQLDIEEETRLNVTYVPLEELLSKSDFLSLNAPSTSETRHIIDGEALSAMKPEAILINTARGALVDEYALAEALKTGIIRAAALDVFEFGDHPIPELIALENVVMTPHIGTQTTTARLEMAQAVSDNVIGFLEGDRPVSRVLLL